MHPRVLLRLVSACFCCGMAIGIFLAGILPRLVTLGIDAFLGVTAIFIIIDTYTNPNPSSKCK
jgi:hypothetical protein